jgi:hypothetical protein
MADTKSNYVGDEFVEEENIDEKGTELQGLYDLVLPPGVPQKLIVETMEKFNLEVIVRKCALKTIDVEPENLLVLRGELDAVNNAHDYIFQEMSKKYNYKK